MSERIVNDPSLHGWTEENGKWVWDGTDSGAGMIISETEPDAVDGTQWLNALTGEVFIYDDGKWLEFPGGKDGAAGADGNIADGTADGIVATWDSTANGGAGQWTPDSTVVVSGNNVGIGTNSPSKKIVISNNGANGIEFEPDDAGRMSNAMLSYDRASSTYTPMHFDCASYIFRTTDPNTQLQKDCLTIDATGNVGIGGIPEGGSVYDGADLELNGSDTERGSRLLMKNPTSKWAITSFSSGPTDDLLNFYSFQQGDNVLQIDGTTGNATFSGTVKVEGNRPVSTKLDIIKTLSTLRQATMDETRDIRESLRSAIDELVAGFEQEISTMEESE